MPDFTGRIRYRKTWTGRLVVELESRYMFSPSHYNRSDVEERLAWIEAKAEYLNHVFPQADIV